MRKQKGIITVFTTSIEKSNPQISVVCQIVSPQKLIYKICQIILLSFIFVSHVLQKVRDAVCSSFLENSKVRKKLFSSVAYLRIGAFISRHYRERHLF